MVQYLDKPYTLHEKQVNINNACYGKKLPTRYMILIEGEKRMRRVYATCFSNCASCWIVYNKEVRYLRDF